MKKITESYNWKNKGDDWYVIPLCVVGVVLVFTVFAGTEIVFNVMVTFFSNI